MDPIDSRYLMKLKGVMPGMYRRVVDPTGTWGPKWELDSGSGKTWDGECFLVRGNGNWMYFPDLQVSDPEEYVFDRLDELRYSCGAYGSGPTRR